MSYTNVLKPSGTTYTNDNPVGKEQYDQASVSYDSSLVFYDGVNQSQYTNVSVGNAWNISKASLYQTYNPTANDTVLESLFFSPNGLTMYILGGGGDSISQYTLGTAWDISTATFVRQTTFADDNSLEAIYFREDGLKVYVLGATADEVNEYNLSTAWNISTRTLLQTFDMTVQDTSPRGLSFSSDGGNMYILGATGDKVYQYTLNTPWNVSSSVFSQSFSVASQTTTPDGIFFRNDGRKFYLMDSGISKVYEYDISTAWNITTATFVQSYAFSASDLNTFAIFFKPDGTRLYITNQSTSRIAEYRLNTAYTNVSKPTL